MINVEEAMRIALVEERTFYFTYFTLVKVSIDFIREMKDHIYWYKDLKNYMLTCNPKLYRELFGKEENET